MKAAVTGGRAQRVSLLDLEALAEQLKDRGVTELRQGCAGKRREGIEPGVDSAVAEYLRERAVCKVDPWPAKWDQHGKYEAGHIRNRAMLQGSWGKWRAGQRSLFGDDETDPVDVLFAFEGGTGTADCVNAATQAGIEIVELPHVLEPRIVNRHHHHRLPRAWRWRRDA